jgi:hypothetical protein
MDSRCSVTRTAISTAAARRPSASRCRPYRRIASSARCRPR